MTPPSQRHPTRGLTEGAILAALTAIIATTVLVAPQVAILLAPLPIILLVIRWGLRIAVLACIVAAAALFEFAGPLAAVSGLATFAPLGLALGWGIRRQFTAQWTILAGAAVFLPVLVAMFAAANVIMHQDILGMLIATQVKGLQMALGMQQRLGVPASQTEELRQLIAVLPQFLRYIFAPALAAAAIIWSYLCYTVSRAVLRRVGYALPGVPPILTWRMPPAAASVTLWLGALLSLASMRIPQLAAATFDAMLINLVVFGFLGALVGVTWANRRRYPAFIQILFGFMLLGGGGGILPILGLAILGMLDTWWDFRRLVPRDGGSGTTSDTTTAANTTGDATDVRPARRASKVVPQR